MNPAKTSSPVTKTATFEARKKGSKTCHNVFTYDGYTYVRTTSTVNKNGSIMWRCENNRGTHNCKATCSTIGDKIIRQTNAHRCPILTTTHLIYKHAERDMIKIIIGCIIFFHWIIK